jgi:hypothetical protein
LKNVLENGLRNWLKSYWIIAGTLLTTAATTDWKTAGKLLENCRKTAGKLLKTSWRTASWRTAAKRASERAKSCSLETLETLENCLQHY